VVMGIYFESIWMSFFFWLFTFLVRKMLDPSFSIVLFFSPGRDIRCVCVASQKDSSQDHCLRVNLEGLLLYPREGWWKGRDVVLNGL